MVLGRDGCQLPLGGAVLVHVPAGTDGVPVHEDRMAAGLLGRRLDALFLCLLLFPLPLLLGELAHLVHYHFHVHAPEEALHGLGPVVTVELLRSHGQDAVVEARLHGGPGPVQSRAAARTRILHVRDRDPLQAVGRQGHLASDAVLKGVDAPARVGEPGRLDVVQGEAAVLEDEVQGLAGQRLDVPVHVLAELDHCRAEDVDGPTHLLLLLSVFLYTKALRPRVSLPTISF